MANTKQKYKELSIYWKGDSAISFSPLEHYRKKEENDDKNNKWTLMGYKINVTVTNDTFKTKDSIYLEYEELLNLILVLSWKLNSFEAKRNSKTSNIEKTFRIKKINQDILVNFDVKNKDKLNFKISNLNKIILYKLAIDVLLQEIPRSTNINITKVELLEFISELLFTKEDTTSSEWTDNWNLENNNTNNNDWKYISFINTYNWKSFENKIKVSDEFYNFMKSADLSKLNKSDLLKKIKDKTDKTENKFLSLDNIDTLKII